MNFFLIERQTKADNKKCDIMIWILCLSPLYTKSYICLDLGLFLKRAFVDLFDCCEMNWDRYGAYIVNLKGDGICSLDLYQRRY